MRKCEKSRRKKEKKYVKKLGGKNNLKSHTRVCSSSYRFYLRIFQQQEKVLLPQKSMHIHKNGECITKERSQTARIPNTKTIIISMWSEMKPNPMTTKYTKQKWETPETERSVSENFPEKFPASFIRREMWELCACRVPSQQFRFLFGFNDGFPAAHI